MSKILTVEKISFNYEKEKILDNISLSINEGEFVSIVGNSGSGKSTLLHILALIKSINNGEIFYKEEKATNKNSIHLRRNNFGFIYQQHKLMKDFNVIENIILPSLIIGNSKKESIIKANELLDKVGLSNYGKRRINELSGGEKQRISIARAVINNPKIIFADEPTGNLDSNNSENIFKLFYDMSREINSSIILVTHDKNISEKTDSIYLLEEHKLNKKY